MEAESVFEQIVNESPAAAFVWRLEPDWPVEYVSAAIIRFGYQPSDFLAGNLKYADIVHPEDQGRVAAEVAHYLEAGSQNFFQQYRLIAADGGTRWIDDWTRIVRDDNGRPTHAHGVILDVTESINTTQRMQRALDATGTLFLHLDLHGNITQVNQNTCRLTGKSPEALIGTNWIDAYVPPELRGEIYSVTDLIAMGRFTDPGEYVNEIEVAGRRYKVQWHFTVDRNEKQEPQGLLSFGHDITQFYQTQDLLKDIAGSLPGALFEYTLNPDGSDAIVYMNEACVSIWEVEEAELNGSAARLWETVLAEDLPAMQQSVAASSETLEEWFHEWRISPAPGRIKWLQGRGRPRRLPDGGTHWNTIITDITEVRQFAEARLETLKKSIFALASVLEARDPYTAGHEQNVAGISVKIAAKLGLPQGQIEGLELAAIIHDIGKIGIPAEILTKPIGLTGPEYDLIKTHASAGADMVRDIEFEWPIADIIEQHHERLDGSGYPHGLKGDEICQEARIIAVADTLEAMASHRPYRAGLGMEAAVEVINARRDRFYDSRVVDACMALIESGDINL